MIQINRLGVCSILYVFENNALLGNSGKWRPWISRRRPLTEACRSPRRRAGLPSGSSRVLVKWKQSHLPAAFAIQLGKRLLQLIEFLAGFAVLSLGGQALIIGEQLLGLPGQSLEVR